VVVLLECRTGAAETDTPRVAVVGYVRDEVTHGRLDVRQQAALIVRLCARRDWELVSLLYEGGPAKGRSLSRPALSGALQRLAAGEVTCLVVTDLRNLCRSVAEVGGVLDAIDRAGARLVSLEPPIDTGTQAGRVGARVLSAVSEWERHRSIERSRRGLDAARRQGALQPTIEPELKRQITRMRRAGMTLQAIVDELNAAGVPTVRGGSMWRPSSVQAAIGYKRPARLV
jgi:DNA invertase Pin-like site-specific DNA recombinase